MNLQLLNFTGLDSLFHITPFKISCFDSSFISSLKEHLTFAYIGKALNEKKIIRK